MKILIMIITFILTFITSNKIFRSIIYKIFREDTLKNIFIIIICILIDIDYFILIKTHFITSLKIAIVISITTALISFFTVKDK